MLKRFAIVLLLLAASIAHAQTEILLPRSIAPVAGGTSPTLGASLPLGTSAVAVNVAGLFAMAQNAEAALTLPGKAAIAVVHDRVETHPSGNQTWIGYLRDYGTNYRVIITTGADGSSGRIALPGNEYWVTTDAGQTWLLDRQVGGLKRAPNLVNDSIVPPPQALRIAQSKVASQMPVIGETMPTPQSTVDVMVVYTPSLVTQLGSGLQARLDQLISIANQAYIDSEVAIKLRLVHSAPVAYSDSTSNDTALYELSGSSGSGPVTIPASLANVAGWRNTYGADLVVLMRAFNSAQHISCGVGWVLGYGSESLTGDSEFGYSVVSNGSSGNSRCDDLTFVHEIGHNMGNMHDRRTDPSSTTGVFPYSFGYGVDNSFVTVMGYPTYYTNAPTIGKFSNPSLLCNGQACGVGGTGSTSANNALSMNNIRDEVAIFRISTVKTAQTITFGALPGVLAGGTVTATATASSGLTVSFSVASSSICTLSGSAGPSVTVTAVAAGTCEVRANQAGDDSYNAATQVPRSFTVTAQAPSAPQNVTLVPGPGRMSVQFDAPASNGGLPITGYTATCSASGQTTRSTTGTNSPLVVTDLKAGVTYSCSVTASNGSFTSPASATKTDKPRSTDLTPILMLLLD